MKRFLPLFFLPLFFSFALASVFLVAPVSQSIEPNSTVLLGSVMPGETLELVFSNEDGTGSYWNQVEVLRDSVPSSWPIKEPELFAESLLVSIRIPSNEVEKLQNIRLRLSDVRNPLHAQEFSLQVLVRNDLIKSSFSPVQDSVLLGETAVYKLVIVNNSLSAHAVRVSSSLPSFWFAPRFLFLPPKPNAGSVQELLLEVHPKSYGARSFSFLVDSELSQKRLSVFQNNLLVKPTLEGKFQPGLFGLPFFSPNLSVFFFLNGFLGSLQ